MSSIERAGQAVREVRAEEVKRAAEREEKPKAERAPEKAETSGAAGSRAAERQDAEGKGRTLDVSA